MQKKTTRLVEPPDEFIDAVFEEDAYPRRRLSRSRVAYRRHARWLGGLSVPVRMTVLTLYLVVCAIALAAGLLIGGFFRFLIGY